MVGIQAETSQEAISVVLNLNEHIRILKHHWSWQEKEYLLNLSVTKHGLDLRSLVS